MAFSLDEFTRRETARVNAALDVYCPERAGSELRAAMRYALLAGGKRIRPLLALATAEALGQPTDTVLPFACALELIHTFSLIHDDLPAMDDDDLRRGVPTCHKVFGEATAILAGDALHSLAFATLAQSPSCPPRVFALLAQACGEMCHGQADDLAAEGKRLTLPVLQAIHSHKTGALLRVSVVGAAVLCGATPEQEAALAGYGSAIGVAFQIVDDILDLTSDDVTLGKPAGSDLKHDKATYPKLVGLARSRELAREALAEALAALAPFGDPAQALSAIARYIVERNT